MKKVLIFLLILCFAASGCAPKRYVYDFYDTFDTFIQLTAYAKNEQDFQTFADRFHRRMRELHALFDVYHDYAGIQNIKTINDNAGIVPVAADPLLIELIELCIAMHDETHGTVNIALGPVLLLWHDAREAALADPAAASLPRTDALEAARALCDIRDIVVDRDAGTVFLRHKGMRLDVGAAAKGFAVEVAARELADGRAFLVNAGGNVLARIPEGSVAPDAWKIGIFDPIAEEGFTEVLEMRNGNAVTSGDYQRCFTVDGTRYGHIIDPETLLPANHYRQVTVTGEDSGIADILSTALFVLPPERGRALASQMGYDAIWVYADGHIERTDKD